MEEKMNNDAKRDETYQTSTPLRESDSEPEEKPERPREAKKTEDQRACQVGYDREDDQLETPLSPQGQTTKESNKKPKSIVDKKFKPTLKPGCTSSGTSERQREPGSEGMNKSTV